MNVAVDLESMLSAVVLVILGIAVAVIVQMLNDAKNVVRDGAPIELPTLQALAREI
ncbi:hypothetical protein FHP_029 [Pseudomonas phage vB_PaeM_fHoPae01]|nr:hypothetical protein FHP_029 [Pseudomonas phage vB_PaeM_fHoPae01]